MNRSLGDITAENDHLMLDKAFFETPDYKTIIESSHKCVIVGRRGTGKSALNYKLEKYWSLHSKSFVFSIAPDEIQIIGLRDILEIFGDNFSHVKAGAKLIWKYAVYLEIGVFLFEHYKFSKKFNTKGIFEHIIYWQKERGTFAAKARKRLRSFINKDESPQSAIADLIDILDIDQLEERISSVLRDIDIVANILVDKVDEGYSPDTIGIALVDGFVQAVIDINNNFPEKVKSYIFIRDNIYRAIAKSDNDFTRNIESHILRLHWNEYNLFNLVCNRLRVANNISTENNRKLWNQFTAKELQNNAGFRTCLRLTLYRPRDILVLLNNAFDKAGKEGRKKIIPDDIDSSSKEISENRLNDLYKEYNSIFPSIDIFSNSLSGGPANFKYTELESCISEILQKDDYQPEKQKDIALIDTPLSVIQRLYSVGFLGVKDMGRDNFIFCHDGRAPSKKLNKDDVFLIHPCYWLALNLTEKTLEMSDAEEIYDEYDIEVTSITEDQRNAKIEELLSRIRNINEGVKGAYEFEKWCFDSVKILFAGSLVNIELHPNKNKLQQRDIVGTNQSDVPVWKRIYNDYATRQVIFEVKNIKELNRDNFRQVNSYLSGTYGNIAFIICRGINNNLTRQEINWIKELHYEHKKIVVKLSTHFIEKHLRKQRNPQKHDAVNKELGNLLDTYQRKYLSTNS